MSANIPTVVRVMDEFATNTGLLSSSPVSRRYLWTDAFAVCNYLGLEKHTKDDRYGHLAVDLVNAVHEVLGKHRSDDTRTGWISNLPEEEGKLHPTANGLRIGKKMQERSPSDPLDDDLEWDRDGQYYHYLTKWMHGLNCASRCTGDERYNVLAAELVRGTHDKFTYDVAMGKKRMYWKMSIDLSRPLVRSMGHHDPLDGYITYLQIQQSLNEQDKLNVNLERQVNDLAGICKGKDWTTTDPLGLGGLLCDAYRILSMMIDGKPSVQHEAKLLTNILQACDKGLDAYVSGRYSNQLTKSAEHRLAFRELGLSIGLQAVQQMQQMLQANKELLKLCAHLPKSLEKLQKYTYIVEEINSFWSDPGNQKARSWKSHLDINMVMWATSLMPDGFLCV